MSMSIMNLNRTKERGSNRSKRAESAPSPPTAAPSPAQPTVETPSELETQFQLGNTMLEAVDRLTGMSADEIEVVAERLMEGARETEEVILELARRVREYGVFANERLANFVKAANKCAETARAMHGVLAEPHHYSPEESSAQGDSQGGNA